MSNPFSFIPDESLVNNPEQRLPFIFLADTSGSMGVNGGEPIRQLNAGLDALHREISSDLQATKRVEVSVVTFGGTPQVHQPFATIDRISSLSGLTAQGGTPMGGAIMLGLDLLDQRMREYRNHGITPLRPWLWICSDGAPGDDTTAAAQRLADMERRNKVVAFTLGIQDADFNMLASLSPRPPMRLEGLKFPELFQWLGVSLRSASSRTPGADLELALPPSVRFLKVPT